MLCVRLFGKQSLISSQSIYQALYWMGNIVKTLGHFIYRKHFSPLQTTIKMAFINISDPNKRKETVQEYIKTRDEIRQKNENRKEGNLLKEKVIEERFRPIVAATEKSAETIKSALEKSHAEEKTPYEFYSSLTKNRDRYFSIYRTNGGSFRLGNTDIRIDEENTIHIGSTSYEYTSGLWDLLMLNAPQGYTVDDIANYKQIVEETDLVNNPHIVTSKSRYTSTSKYKFLVDLFKEAVKKEEEEGSGIILPGDINSLKKRLQLLCGERAAGNIKSTTPEIVAILDEILRQNHISKAEYNIVCEKLGC